MEPRPHTGPGRTIEAKVGYSRSEVHVEAELTGRYVSLRVTGFSGGWDEGEATALLPLKETLLVSDALKKESELLIGGNPNGNLTRPDDLAERVLIAYFHRISHPALVFPSSGQPPIDTEALESAIRSVMERVRVIP